MNPKDKYFNIQNTSSGGWQRPSDWIDISGMVTAVDNKFVGTYAVFDTEENSIDLTYVNITGGYTIDWGDGFTNSYASYGGASHNYDYSTLTDVCSRGYKIATIIITPTVGGNHFTDINLFSPTSKNLKWLEMNLSLPSIGAYAGFFLASISTPLLESITLKSFGTNNSIAYALLGSFNLMNLELPGTGVITNFSNAYRECGFTKVNDSTSLGTNYSYACYNMARLQEPLVANLTNAITCDHMYYGCTKLTYINTYNTTNCTNFDNFAGNTAIVIFPAIDLMNSTNSNGIVSGVTTLKAFKALNIGLSLNLSNNKIERLQAIEVFNNLQTVAGQTLTLTLTGNPCTSTLTPTDKLIATGKGWTLVL